MTGLRIGFLAAPKYFTQVCAKLQGQITSGASSVGQYASCEAMKIELEYVTRNEERIVEVLEGLDIKRQYVLQRLNGMPHVGYAHPIAAFYVFVDMGYYFPKSTEGKTKQIYGPKSSNAMESCDDFVEYVLRDHHVALVPGSAFGEKAALRISYASSLETLEHAMDGLENALKSLRIIEN
jgi:aspartate/methionine/tyrosine aminotransferase